MGRFVSPLRDDWGFFHTVELNLEKLRGFSGRTLGVPEAATVERRISVLREEMARAPKSVKWKLRARVGERVTWYEIPDELE